MLLYLPQPLHLPACSMYPRVGKPDPRVPVFFFTLNIYFTLNLCPLVIKYLILGKRHPVMPHIILYHCKITPDPSVTYAPRNKFPTCPTTPNYSSKYFLRLNPSNSRVIKTEHNNSRQAQNAGIIHRDRQHVWGEGIYCWCGPMAGEWGCRWEEVGTATRFIVI